MRFLVTSYSNPDDSRVIEGTGFRVDDGGAICIVNKEELVARLVNVNVEALPSGSKESSAKLAKLGGKYVNFDLLDWLSGPHSPEDVNKVSADINSLAGSVLSQVK